MRTNFGDVRAIQKAQIIPPDIIRIEADENYSIIHLQGGKKITLAKTLKQFQSMLDPQFFLRPCRSHLINKRFLKNISESQVTLKNGVKLPISRRRRENLYALMNITNN